MQGQTDIDRNTGPDRHRQKYRGRDRYIDRNTETFLMTCFSLCVFQTGVGAFTRRASCGRDAATGARTGPVAPPRGSPRRRGAPETPAVRVSPRQRAAPDPSRERDTAGAGTARGRTEAQ